MTHLSIFFLFFFPLPIQYALEMVEWVNMFDESTFMFRQDPWWNPAVEEQAVMRIHRIGQKNRVVIKRFIVKVHFVP